MALSNPAYLTYSVFWKAGEQEQEQEQDDYDDDDDDGGGDDEEELFVLHLLHSSLKMYI